MKFLKSLLVLLRTSRPFNDFQNPLVTQQVNFHRTDASITFASIVLLLWGHCYSGTTDLNTTVYDRIIRTTRLNILTQIK